jgi:hypothetical protein
VSKAVVSLAGILVALEIGYGMYHMMFGAIERVLHEPAGE